MRKYRAASTCSPLGVPSARSESSRWQKPVTRRGVLADGAEIGSRTMKVKPTYCQGGDHPKISGFGF
jgi:hypothetical protein